MQVWRVRYNLRDQLLLTGGSDSKVVLLNVPSLASDTMSEEEEEAEEPKVKFQCLVTHSILETIVSLEQAPIGVFLWIKV